MTELEHMRQEACGAADVNVTGTRGTAGCGTGLLARLPPAATLVHFALPLRDHWSEPAAPRTAPLAGRTVFQAVEPKSAWLARPSASLVPCVPLFHCADPA